MCVSMWTFAVRREAIDSIRFLSARVTEVFLKRVENWSRGLWQMQHVPPSRLICWDRVSLWTWSLLIRLWAGQQASGSSCLLLLYFRSSRSSVLCRFHMGPEELNTGLHADIMYPWLTHLPHPHCSHLRDEESEAQENELTRGHALDEWPIRDSHPRPLAL